MDFASLKQIAFVGVLASMISVSVPSQPGSSDAFIQSQAFVQLAMCLAQLSFDMVEIAEMGSFPAKLEQIRLPTGGLWQSICMDRSDWRTHE